MRQADIKLHDTVVLFHNIFTDAVTFVTPHFDMAIRLYALKRGKKPWQLQSTQTQCMINKAYAIIEDQKPKLKKNVFGGEDFVSLDERDPADKPGVEQAQAWLRSLLRDADKINILHSIDATFESALTYGTGYRMPFARKNQKGKWYVSSRDVDIFQIIPAPVGGEINPMDPYDDTALPYFFHIDWMSDDQIKALSAFPGYLKDEAEKLFETAVQNEAGIGYEYVEKFRVIGGVNYGDVKNDWRTQYISSVGGKGAGCKRRVVHWYSRIDNRWRIIAQDNFCIYDGPLPLGDRMLGLAKYTITNDFNNWFGIGKLEMIEDVLIAYLVNRNYRLDHIGRVMFPAKWIRQELFEGHEDSDFYERPNSVYQVPRSLQNMRLTDIFHYDRAPEISQQTFIEDRQFVELIQEIDGVPDMADKMSGSNTATSTATGTQNFLAQTLGRVDAESMLLEYGGLAQEARLLLCLGEKYINEETFVRDNSSPNGTGWRSIDSAYIGDRYTVRTHGTKNSSDEAAKFGRLLSLYPLWQNNPMVDQYALNQELAGSSGISNLNELLNAPSPAGQGVAPAGSTAAEPGGLAAPANVRNSMRSVASATPRKRANQPL